MKNPLDTASQPDQRFRPWRKSAQPGSRRERTNLLAGLTFLLVLLFICVWIGLTHQFHARPPSVSATTPALSQVNPPRRDSSLVYDPIHQVVLLFGGVLMTPGGAQSNETWLWNGQSWQQEHPTISPPALQGSMVYDAASHQIILFLNQIQSGGTVANEMWTWEGNTWHQLRPALMPEIIGASMAYDTAQGQILLFGGEIPGPGQQNGTLTNATWLWNGSTWYQPQMNQTPPTRQHALLVYDSTAQQMLLFGGINTAGTQSAPDDTWVWRTNGWVQISAAGAPGDLYESAVYDAATQTVIVYATEGSLTKLEQPGSSTPVSQTWLWNGTGWKLLH